MTTAEEEITAQECGTSTSTLCTKLRMVLFQAQVTVEKANMANALAVADLTLQYAKQEYVSRADIYAATCCPCFYNVLSRAHHGPPPLQRID